MTGVEVAIVQPNMASSTPPVTGIELTAKLLKLAVVVDEIRENLPTKYMGAIGYNLQACASQLRSSAGHTLTLHEP